MYIPNSRFVDFLDLQFGKKRDRRLELLGGLVSILINGTLSHTVKKQQKCYIIKQNVWYSTHCFWSLAEF